MVMYTPNERHADAMGTFHTGPGDDIATLWSLITTTRVLNGRHAGTRPVLPQRAGYKRPKRTHVPAGNGTLEHTTTVAAAVSLCERNGVEFWALAHRGVFGVQTLADGKRTYVRIDAYGTMTAINADGPPRDDVHTDDAPAYPAPGTGAVRPLHAIARDIRMLWPNMYFGAVPYVDAMSTLTGIGEAYGQDDARGIVRYFLANASTWRGTDARRIKAELKALIGAR